MQARIFFPVVILSHYKPHKPDSGPFGHRCIQFLQKKSDPKIADRPGHDLNMAAPNGEAPNCWDLWRYLEGSDPSQPSLKDVLIHPQMLS